MSYNQVSWNPTLGSGSNPLYDMPSGTPISGSQITPLVTPISAGSTSGWPTPPGSPYNDITAVPTIAQINASSGINQVLGLLNRRIVLWNYWYGYSVTPFASYVTASTAVTASFFSSIYTKIAALRAVEGLSVYSFPPVIPTPGAVWPGYPVYAYHVAHMRKALALDGIQDILCRLAPFDVGAHATGGGGGVCQYDESEPGTAWTYDLQVGEIFIPFVGYYWTRGLAYFPPPEYCASYSGPTPTLNVPMQQGYVGYSQQFDVGSINVYDNGIETSLPGGSVTWPGRATLSGTLIIAEGSGLLPPAPTWVTATGTIASSISAAVGQWLAFQIASQEEVNGVQPFGNITPSYYGGSASVNRPSLDLNWS